MFSFGRHRLSNGVEIDIPHVDTAVFDPQTMRSDWNDIDVHDIDTVQRLPIGTVLKRGPRHFMYGSFAGTVTKGQGVQSSIPAAAHDALAPEATAVDSTSFEITSPASGSDDIEANEYANGYAYLQVNGTPGYLYEIARNEAMDISATGNFLITLAPGNKLATALVVGDDIALIKHPAKDVVVMTTAGTGSFLGVSVENQVANQFGWIGVKGPHPAASEGTLIIGEEARTSEGTAGEFTPNDYSEATEADRGSVGRVLDIGGDNEFSLIGFYGAGIL